MPESQPMTLVVRGIFRLFLEKPRDVTSTFSTRDYIHMSHLQALSRDLQGLLIGRWQRGRCDCDRSVAIFVHAGWI